MDAGKLTQKLVQKHFPKFGSIRQLFTYQEMGEPTYDGGDVTEHILNTYQVYMIMSDISTYGIFKNEDTAILSIDKSVVFPALDLPVVPKINDKIALNQYTYTIIGIAEDPAAATYQFHIRPIDTV